MNTTPVSSTLFLTIGEHVRRLVAWMTESVYEKEQLAAMALLCAVAGENIFLLGPPGTAKSLVARRLKGVMKDARSFEYLMSRFSTPDEIFGPVSIARLKESDSYERLTDGYLPSADVVFLDEIWKAGPSIQNTLLTAINEHLYHNGTVTMQLPMKVLIAASNELPSAGEGLEALWDRFLVRMVSNCIESDDNFARMLLSPDPVVSDIDENIVITRDVYTRWQSEARAISVSSAMIDTIGWLRRSICAVCRDADDSARYYVSDRRWKKIFRLMQTSAFLNGRVEVDHSDLLLSIHCLWNCPDSREKINTLVADSMWISVKEELDEINGRLRDVLTPDAGDRNAAKHIPDSEFRLYYNSYLAVEGFADGTALIPQWDYRKLSLIDETDGVVFVDNSLRMPVIQIEKSNTVFDIPPNSGKPRRVKLLKCNGGIVVNSIPYSLIRKVSPAGADTAREMFPRHKDCAQLKRRFAVAQKSWEKHKKSISDEAVRNIFVSAADGEMLGQAMKNIDRLFTETGIRINNVEKLAR